MYNNSAADDCENNHANNMIKAIQMKVYLLKNVENIVVKGEIARSERFIDTIFFFKNSYDMQSGQ